MLTKLPYSTFNQLSLALQRHEQSLIIQKKNKKMFLNHAQAFLSQRGRGQNPKGGHGFNSRGIGFTLVA